MSGLWLMLNFKTSPSVSNTTVADFDFAISIIFAYTAGLRPSGSEPDINT